MAPKGRSIMICAVDTEQASNACSWYVDQFHRENDVVHLVYTAKTLKPPMEVFHGLPGTAYTFSQPGTHREMEAIAATKSVIEARYLPILRRKSVKYQLHMYAENVDAPSSRIGEILLRVAEQELQPDLLLLTVNNKPVDSTRDRDCVGGVTSYLIKNCKLPFAIIPTSITQGDEEEP